MSFLSAENKEFKRLIQERKKTFLQMPEKKELTGLRCLTIFTLEFLTQNFRQIFQEKSSLLLSSLSLSRSFMYNLMYQGLQNYWGITLRKTMEMAIVQNHLDFKYKDPTFPQYYLILVSSMFFLEPFLYPVLQVNKILGLGGRMFQKYSWKEFKMVFGNVYYGFGQYWRYRMLENLFTCLLYYQLPFKVDFYQFMLVGPLISAYILRRVQVVSSRKLQIM